MKKIMISSILAAALAGNAAVPFVSASLEGLTDSVVMSDIHGEGQSGENELMAPVETLPSEETLPLEEVLPETETGQAVPESPVVDSPAVDNPVVDNPIIEEPFIEEPAVDEPLKEGGYEFDGYLPDGTPNYIWKGSGVPHDSTMEGVIVEEEDRIFAPDGLTDSLTAAAGENYLKDGVRILNRNAEMSGVYEAYSDGVHRMPDGSYRAYRRGNYFKNGRFGLNGKVYYADGEGRLLSGWIKVADSDAVIGSLKKSDFVWKYCDPQTKVRFQDGYRMINGTGHYFIPEESGNLAFNKSYMIGGQYYYCDKYGVCDTVRLKYGDIVTDESGASLNGFLAVNQLPSGNVVDISTQVMDGSYSFMPKFNQNSSVETFGFEPLALPGGNVYGTLTDDSQKGRIGCWYRNVGSYKGRQIDIKCTITDYTFYSFDGDLEVGYFQVDMKKIGLNATNTRDISASMEFYDHETGEPVEVKGFATFADIDIRQGVEILSPVDDLFVTKDCALLKAPGANIFTAPWALFNTKDADTRYQVQVNYQGHRLAYKFYSGCENYCFSDGRPINGESRYVWKQGYTGNVHDYDIVNGKKGCLWQGWQGLYYGRMGRVSLSEPLSKTVSDQDEKDVLKNTIQNPLETFTYKISHYVPYEMPEFRYSSYVIWDDINEDLQVIPSECRVLLDDGSDVTGWFTITAAGPRISFQAKPEIIGLEGFYDKTYHCILNSSLRKGADLLKYECDRYFVKNTCHVEMNRLQGEEKKDGNEVETVLVLPRGKIYITKKIRESDVNWAHGDPVFLFTAERTDRSGGKHRYETMLSFTKGNYQVGPDGYAVLHTVISDLPLGRYSIAEKQTLRYIPERVTADTQNVILQENGLSSGSFCGEADLTPFLPEAGLTFQNKVRRSDGYSHSSSAVNTVKLIV